MTGPLSAAKIAKLNKSNRAMKDALVGTMLANLGTVSTGSATAVLSDISGSALTIWTGLSSIGGALVSATRSGSPISDPKWVATGGSLVISSASATAVQLTVGDVVNYIAFK